MPQTNSVRIHLEDGGILELPRRPWTDAKQRRIDEITREGASRIVSERPGEEGRTAR